MTVTTGNWQQSLWPGIDEWFDDEYQSHATEYTQFMTTRPSQRQFEETVGMSLLGRAAIKGEGEDIKQDDTQQTYTHRYLNQVRALGTSITLEAYEYNQYGPQLDALQKRPRALARSMQHTKEEAAADVINNGFDDAFDMGTASDGLSLFNSAHPSGPYGSTRSNITAAASLSAVALEDMCIAINGAVDPRGLTSAIMPYCLHIPRQLKYIADRILNSPLQNDTANNAINALKQDASIPAGSKINHYFTDPNAFFIGTSINQAGRGLIHYDNWSIKFGQDNNSTNLNMLVYAYEAYAFGWDEFQGMWGNAGA